MREAAELGYMQSSSLTSKNRLKEFWTDGPEVIESLTGDSEAIPLNQDHACALPLCVGVKIQWMGWNDRSPWSSEGETAEKKFKRLRDEWKANRGPHSSTTKLVMHPSYQKIIGMGQEAIPFLLRELQLNIDVWFWALRAITEKDPVQPHEKGDGQAMANAWLNWGREMGYLE